jgi:hypothetical protein
MGLAECGRQRQWRGCFFPGSFELGGGFEEVEVELGEWDSRTWV